MAENGSDKKMVTLTIDGQTVEVPAGTCIVDAAESIDVAVPHYCYHQGLSVPANCRICQVEIEGQPRLAFGCRTPVAEGMVVHTASEKAKAHQQLVQEFLLCNHPLDCPICDKAGECRLQDYYMDYGQYTPTMVENKYKKHKGTLIGPRIVLDSERCILCSRCIRFCDEVSQTGELGLFHRNNHTEVGVVPGTQLDNAYAGNVVDICPVGALGDRDFRFKCRVWYLRQANSICTGCSKGCNIVVDHQDQRNHAVQRKEYKSQGDRVMRLRPRKNMDVNTHWMCDEGRYGYAWHDEDRILMPAIKSDGAQGEALMREAADTAAKMVKGGGWAVVLSSHMSNEELFLAKTLFTGLGVSEIFVGAPPQGEADDLLRRADKSPNTTGAKALGLTVDTGEKLAALSGKKIWAIDYDVVSALSGFDKFEALIFQGSNVCATSMTADVVLPSATSFEKFGTYTNEDGRVQRFERAFLPLGDAEPGIQIFHRLADLLGVKIASGDAEDIFETMAQSEAAFAGLSHAALGELGAPLAQGVSA